MARCGHPGAAAPRHRESQDQARGKERAHVCPWAGAAGCPGGVPSTLSAEAGFPAAPTSGVPAIPHV